jgi:DNA-directed RNA polymerase I subunit RPA1
MMGKRVNFAARSVISPDPNIETNEIGVPPVFAKKLTYPEPVTNHNFYELKEAVLNGVDKWPGAAAIENENGQVINLRTKNFEERQALANQLLAPSNTSVTGARNKKVHRHLNNGDIVLMNRQPTLHKPSMMAHRARVLPGEKTIRMHYANCNTYNADFDGDEMNLHVPQSEETRAEITEICMVPRQILAPQANKPCMGIVQDALCGIRKFTIRDTFMAKSHVMNILMWVPGWNGIVPPPAILKPKALWTGKRTSLGSVAPAHTDCLERQLRCVQYSVGLHAC